jgi:hypothetical protein
MNIQAEKMEVMEMLLKVRSESLITQIKTLLKKEMIVGYTTAGEPLTLKQYQDRMELAKRQVAEGKVTSHSDLKKKIKQW